MEDTEPVPLSDEQVERVAVSVVRKWKSEEYTGHLLGKLLEHLQRDNWTDITKRIVLSREDLIVIAKRLVFSWQFVGMVVVVAAMGFATLWKLVGDVARKEAAIQFTNEVTRQVSVMLKEPVVSNIMVAVISAESSNLMSHVVVPALNGFKSNLSNETQNVEVILNGFRDSLATARTNTDNLKSVSDFALLVLKAQGDDPDAFWKLHAIGDETTNAHSKIARDFCRLLAESVNLRRAVMLFFETDPWVGYTNKPETASQQDYANRFLAGLTGPERLTLLRQYCDQKRFPLEERLKFLEILILNSGDLMFKNEACLLMAREAQMNKNFLGQPEILAWYRNWANTNKEPLAEQKRP